VSSAGLPGETARLGRVARHLFTAILDRRPRLALAVLLAVCVTSSSGCDLQADRPTPLPTPGTPAKPREVNLIAREYAFSPDTVDVVPGETILLHLVNAGLDVHEAIIGDAATQDAWEAAEAAAAGAPPGLTPRVSVRPDLAGLRLVVRSGERADAVWTVPPAAGRMVVGCHIPGHWANGMMVPVRVISP
jgi:uncharacterized cupredoxin-like copper-binding protein